MNYANLFLSVPELVEGYKAKPSLRAALFAQRRGPRAYLHLFPFDKLRVRIIYPGTIQLPLILP